MKDVFRRWRRTAGVVTLLMALAVVAIWIRSFVVGDVLWVQVGSRVHQFITADGRLYWWGYYETDLRPNLPLFDSYTFYEPAQGVKAICHHSIFRRKLVSSKFTEWIIYYRFIACPLALLSAYLIFSPQPKRACVSSTLMLNATGPSNHKTELRKSS